VAMFVRASMGMGMRSACHLCMMVARVAVRVRTMFMAMVPKFCFIQQKEKDQPDEQGHKQIMRPGLAFKGFG